MPPNDTCLDNALLTATTAAEDTGLAKRVTSWNFADTSSMVGCMLMLVVDS